MYSNKQYIVVILVMLMTVSIASILIYDRVINNRINDRVHPVEVKKLDSLVNELNKSKVLYQIAIERFDSVKLAYDSLRKIGDELSKNRPKPRHFDPDSNHAFIINYIESVDISE